MKKLIMLFLLLIATACQSKPVTGKVVSVAGSSNKDVSVNELAMMLKKKDFVSINGHIPFAGNSADTDLPIPYNEIEQNLSQLPMGKMPKSFCAAGVDA